MPALPIDVLDQVAAFAAPLSPGDREIFITKVIERLAALPVLGPGIVHRAIAEAQAPFVVSQRVVGTGSHRSKYDGHYARARRSPIR